MVVLSAPFGCAQSSIPEALVQYNAETVPYITTEELAKSGTKFILDARKQEEYDVSHLKDAQWVGFDEFEITKVLESIKDKNAPIVVYCSIGVRSEDIGEKLLAAGYSQVHNLYGGIFEWKNRGNPVYDNNQKETNKVHPYNSIWGRLLTNGEKAYKP